MLAHKKFCAAVLLLCVASKTLGSRGDNGNIRLRYPAVRLNEKTVQERLDEFQNYDRTLEVDQEANAEDETNSPPKRIVEKNIEPFPKEIPPSVVYKEKIEEGAPPRDNLKKVPEKDGPKTLQEIENDGGVSIPSPPEPIERSNSETGEPITLHQKTARLQRQRFPFHRRRYPHREFADRVDERRPPFRNRPNFHERPHNGEHFIHSKPPRRQDTDVFPNDFPNRLRYPDNRKPIFGERIKYKQPRPPFRNPINEDERIQIKFEPTRPENQPFRGDGETDEEPSGTDTKKPQDLDVASSYTPELTIRNPQEFDESLKKPFAENPDKVLDDNRHVQKRPDNNRQQVQRPRPPNRRLPNFQQQGGFADGQNINVHSSFQIGSNEGPFKANQNDRETVQFPEGNPPNRRPIANHFNHQKRPNERPGPELNRKPIRRQNNTQSSNAPGLGLQRPQITEYRPLPSQKIRVPNLRRPLKNQKVIHRRPITHYKPHKTRPVAFPKPRPLTNVEQSRPKVEYGFIPFFRHEVDEEEVSKTTTTKAPVEDLTNRRKPVTEHNTQKITTRGRATRRPLPTRAPEVTRPKRPERLERPTREPTPAVSKLPDLPSLNSPYSILQPSDEKILVPKRQPAKKVVPKVNRRTTTRRPVVKKPVEEKIKKSPSVQSPSLKNPEPIVNIRPSKPKGPTRNKPIRRNPTHQNSNNQWTVLTEPGFKKVSTTTSHLSHGKDKELPVNKRVKPIGYPTQNRGPTGIKFPDRAKKPTRKPAGGRYKPKVEKVPIKTTLKPSEEPTTKKEEVKTKPPPTKPSFTGMISGIFGWNKKRKPAKESPSDGKVKTTTKKPLSTRAPKPTRRTKFTTTERTTRKPFKPTRRTTPKRVPTTTTTKATTTRKPFVYVPKQIYPTTKEPTKKQEVVEETSEKEEVEEGIEEESFLNNLFGLFAEEEDQNVKVVTKKPEEVDKDGDRWLGGFKMSHFGGVSSTGSNKDGGSGEVSATGQTGNRYCGSRTDLEFCSVNKLYPRNEVQSVMKRCKVHVDKMVADEIAKLAEHGPVYEYPAETDISSSTPNDPAIDNDDERPWPWTQFVYSKDGVCQSSKRLSDPGYARDMTGAWRIIIQTSDNTQRVSTEICKATSKPCSNMKGEYKKSRCVQKYSYQMLMSVNPDNMEDCPEMRLFRFPTACVCQVQVV